MAYRAEEVWGRYSIGLEEKISFHIKNHSRIHAQALKFTEEGARILEVGCGSGVDSSYLSLEGRWVVGLDVSVYSLRVAKKVNFYLVGGAVLSLGSISHLPFKNHSFDLVYSSGLMHYFKELTPLMEEQRRILKDGGYLIIDVPYIFSLFTIEKRIRRILNKWPWGEETQYSLRRLEKLFEEHDFEIVGRYSWGLDSVSNLLFNFSDTRAGRKLPPYFQNFYNMFASPLRSLIENHLPVNIGIVGRKG